MKKQINIFTLWLLLAAVAFGQTANVQKSTVTGNLTAGFNTGANTVNVSAGGTINYTTGALLTGNLAEFRSDAGLAIGTDVQAHSDALDQFGGFASASDMADAFTISGWGDSLTAGAGGGGVTFLTRLNTLTGFTGFNGGVGGETASQIATRMLAATSRYGQLVVIWAGRNGVLTDPTSAKAAIASMVAALTTDHYVILSVLNDATEVSGSSGYIAVTTFNNDLATIYGAKYIDVRAYLVALAPNPQDIINIAYRSDGLHLNAAGYSAVGDFIFSNFTKLQGTQTKATGPDQVLTTYLAPPAIGSKTANTGAFTTLSASTSLALPGVLVTPAISTNSPVIQLKQLAGSLRSISLSPDGTAFSFDAKLIPAVDGTTDLGFNSSQLRWRNIFLSGAVTAGSTITGNSLVASAGFISCIRSGQTRVLSPSTDGTKWQFDNTIIPSADASFDLGISATQRWRNLYLSGALVASTFNGNAITTGTGTLTLGAGSTLTTSATNSITLTSTGATNVTLPTSGTLVTTAGNVATATALQTARLINGTSFNGSADITVTAAAGTLTGSTLNSTVTTATIGTLAGLTSNGFVKTSGGTGSLSVDTTTYATAVQLPRANSFSGVGTATTVFTVTIGATQANNTYKVNVTPTSVLSAALFYVTNKTTTTFDVTYMAGLTGTVTFDWSLFP